MNVTKSNLMSVKNLKWLVDWEDQHEQWLDSFSVMSLNARSDLKKILHAELPIKHRIKLLRIIDNIFLDRQDQMLADLCLAHLRVYFIGDGTFKGFFADLRIAALRHNIYLETAEGDFGQIEQLALVPNADITAFNPDFIFCYRDVRKSPLLNVEDAQIQVKKIGEIVGALKKLYGAMCVVNTLPVTGQISDSDIFMESSPSFSISTYNRALAGLMKAADGMLFDLSQLACQSGLEKWMDPNYWNLAKIPVNPSLIDKFSNRLASLFAAHAGKSRRVLVLDCDNTLWGGVVGDDGIEGIIIGQGSANGEAYLDVQRTALALRERGVILAICSKNTEETVLNVFQNHPDMLLREEHISAHRINWIDKAANIQDLSEALNLGLESFVFLDDNPVERARVRYALPEVAVPEVGETVEYYSSILLQTGYFNSLALTEEDKNRAAMYRANSQREELKNLGDMDSYLDSLEMKISFQAFDSVGGSRIAQLISKSNQFNLTTRRYSLADVSKFQDDPDKLTIQIRVADKFGDNGMVSVVIVNKNQEIKPFGLVWKVDLWLMSCRVLERRVENQVLQYLVKKAQQKGVNHLIGEFIPSSRNAIVKDHYQQLGFSQLEEKADGKTIWQLNTSSFDFISLPFTVENN